MAKNKEGTASVATKKSFLNSNPVMRRLDRITDTAAGDASTYGGIFLKTGIFLLFCLAGLVLQLVLEGKLSTGESFSFTIYKKFVVTMYKPEAIAIVAATALGVVFQLLAFWVKGSTPVTGALYCVTQGYFVSFLVFKVLKGYEYLGALALLITVVIILVMLFLYSRGIIKVTKKFRTVMITLFATVIGSSLLVVLGYFIPGTRELVMRLQDNLILSIGTSVIFIIIAALFLICDFDTVDHVVNDQLPKKYEWWAAFGLAFTVIWLYLKVLDLIMTVAGNKSDS